MQKKKTDRRVKYTKMVIKNSFVKFLKEKPISKITVKEICDDADINRATFYAHYQDQYDLLRQIENEIIYDINQYLKGYDFKANKLFPVEMIRKILDYVDENAELFDLFLNMNGDLKFQQEVIKYIGIQHFIPMFGNNYIDKENAQYIYHFLACGAVGVIQMWLKDGRKKTTQEIAELILKISVNGRSAFV